MRGHRITLHPGVELVRGDVSDPSTVARALRGVDAVCHQAAMVGLGQDMLDVADYVRHNDLGTAVLLRELAAIGFKGRLVLASSMVVYGEGGYRCRRHGAVEAGSARGRGPGGRSVRAAMPPVWVRARAVRDRRVRAARSA